MYAGSIDVVVGDDDVAVEPAVFGRGVQNGQPRHGGSAGCRVDVCQTVGVGGGGLAQFHNQSRRIGISGTSAAGMG